MSTNSTAGARTHARAQAQQVQMRIPLPPSDADPSKLVWTESLPGGSYVARVVGRGIRVRLTDVDGSACAHLMMYRADAPWERLNVADTIKVPWQAYLGTGHPLLSDQGRVLATVVADTSHHHDALSGMTAAGRAKMLLAATKHGLDIRDVAPTVALFKGTRVGTDGALAFSGSAGPGTAVDLLIHLPVVLAVVNTAHPLDPAPAPGALDLQAWRAENLLDRPANQDPEYLRALFNTESTWAAAQSHGGEK